MWKKIALLSLVANGMLAATAALIAHGKTTRTVHGRLVVPRLDFGFFDPAEGNTLGFSIETDAGYESCRVPTPEVLIASKKNIYGSSPAIVAVEIEDGPAGKPRCRSIVTVREGYVAQPK